MITPRPSLALIAGPTASGKSALALELAQRTGGVLVNADSAQVYRDLPVLSAAPTGGEMRKADHRLYGTIDGSTPCSAADWAAMARRETADIHRSGRLPILVGGTGLYIRTLLDGIAPVPTIAAALREEVRASSTERNRARLVELDPEAAGRLDPTDTARICRALEVVLSTGKTLRHWQERREGGIGAQVALRPLILLPPRQWLYDRCDRRFAEMVVQGAVEEVQALLRRQLPPTLPVMRAIGVPELARHLSGEISLEAAILAGQQATRRYAKRQYTWFAHQPPATWTRFNAPLERENMADALRLLSTEAQPISS